MTSALAPQVGEIVATAFHRLVETMVHHAVDSEGIFVVSSPTAGVGCSLSTWCATRTVTTRRAVWLDATPSWQPLHLHLELLRAAGIDLTGTRRNVVDATEELADVHDHHQLLIVVDDAHLLTHDTLAHLTSLHRRIAIPVGLIARPDLTTEHRRRALLDRVDRWIEIDALPTDVMIDALERHHPTYQQLPRSDLVELDRNWAKGRWRRWVQFTAALTRYHTCEVSLGTAVEHARIALGANRHQPRRHR